MALKKLIPICFPLLALLFLMINADTVTGATDYPGETAATEKTADSSTSSESTGETISDGTTSATDYPGDTKDSADKTVEKPVEEEITRPSPDEEGILSPEKQDEQIALDSDSGSMDESMARDKPPVEKEEALEDEQVALIDEDIETETTEEVSEKEAITVTDADTGATTYPVVEDFHTVTFELPPLDIAAADDSDKSPLDQDLDLEEIFPDTYTIHKIEDFIVQKKETEETAADSMIIFDSDHDRMIPPSDRYEYLESDQQVLRTDFEMPDFTPQTLSDFLAVHPEQNFDITNTILPGSNAVNEIVGEAAFTLAYRNFKKNSLNTALSLLQKLIHYNYRTSEAYYYLALCLYQKKQYHISINHLLKSLEYSQEDDTRGFFKNYDAIANIYSRIGEYNKAILYYNKALKFSTDQGDIFNKLGFMYYYLDSHDNALKYWQRAGDEGNMESVKNYEWLQKVLKEKK